MKLNPKLSVGDKIVLLHMKDESMSPGTKGVVKSVTNVFGEDIYDVEWENGRKLNLLQNEDTWKLDVKRIKESMDDFMMKQKGRYMKFFNSKFFVDYLKDLRDSGIVNMFGASPYLYMGKERIEHEFKYKEFIDEESEEAFQRVLEKADMAQGKMIEGVIKILQNENKEVDVDSINRALHNYSIVVLQFYIHLLSMP